MGLITKHGILIVEFANQLQEKGLELKEAVIESATLRLRPILMTTGAMVLGAFPLALATGAGAESIMTPLSGWIQVWAPCSSCAGSGRGGPGEMRTRWIDTSARSRRWP